MTRLFHVLTYGPLPRWEIHVVRPRSDGRPWNMFWHDWCWMKSVMPSQRYPEGVRMVVEGLRKPDLARWESFGWEVDAVKQIKDPSHTRVLHFTVEGSGVFPHNLMEWPSRTGYWPATEDDTLKMESEEHRRLTIRSLGLVTSQSWEGEGWTLIETPKP